MKITNKMQMFKFLWLEVLFLSSKIDNNFQLFKFLESDIPNFQIMVFINIDLVFKISKNISEFLKILLLDSIPNGGGISGMLQEVTRK